MMTSFPRQTVARICSRVLARHALAWLWEVLRGIKQLESGRARVAEGPAEVDRYLRAKVLALHELYQLLMRDARVGAREMLGTLAEYEPSAWIEKDCGQEMFRLVCDRVDGIRGTLLERLTRGTPLPEVSTVA